MTFPPYFYGQYLVCVFIKSNTAIYASNTLIIPKILGKEREKKKEEEKAHQAWAIKKTINFGNLGTWRKLWLITNH